MCERECVSYSVVWGRSRCLCVCDRERDCVCVLFCGVVTLEVRARACVRACVRRPICGACMRACAYLWCGDARGACVCVTKRERERECPILWCGDARGVCVCVCVRACACARVRACVRRPICGACMRACAHLWCGDARGACAAGQGGDAALNPNPELNLNPKP